MHPRPVSSNQSHARTRKQQSESSKQQRQASRSNSGNLPVPLPHETGNQAMMETLAGGMGMWYGIRMLEAMSAVSDDETRMAERKRKLDILLQIRAICSQMLENSAGGKAIQGGGVGYIDSLDDLWEEFVR